MQRRDFNSLIGLSSLGLMSYSTPISYNKKVIKKHNFNLNYAPHLGMFKHHVGNDPIDQLNFMADIGFKAFEDNDMRNRDVSLQKKMSITMQKRDIKMGVFVAHQIYWNKPTLTTGKKKYIDEFLNYIQKAVDVAKIVNAKWITVVPGHLDLRQNVAYQTSNVVEVLKKASGILEPHGWQWF